MNSSTCAISNDLSRVCHLESSKRVSSNNKICGCQQQWLKNVSKTTLTADRMASLWASALHQALVGEPFVHIYRWDGNVAYKRQFFPCCYTSSRASVWYLSIFHWECYHYVFFVGFPCKSMTEIRWETVLVVVKILLCTISHAQIRCICQSITYRNVKSRLSLMPRLYSQDTMPQYRVASAINYSLYSQTLFVQMHKKNPSTRKQIASQMVLLLSSCCHCQQLSQQQHTTMKLLQIAFSYTNSNVKIINKT